LKKNFSILEEEKERLEVFRAHLKRVLELNIQKRSTFQLGLNEYADWTAEEFLAKKTGLASSPDIIQDATRRRHYQQSARRSSNKLDQDHSHLRRSKRNLHRRESKDRGQLPDWFWDFFNHFFDNDNNDNDNNQSTDEFDWRTKGVVSSVKNQGECGSCYAFATTAVLESLYAIKTQSQNVIELSPQQIVDCSTDGNYGCNGGLFEPSVEYISGQGGKIATEDSYPYVGTEETCKTADVNEIDLGNIEYGVISKGNETELAEALVNYGPICFGLHVDTDAFMFYESGVLKIDNCPNHLQDLQHALALVGYGYDNDLQTPYWIIKNSWGTSWGENGYLRLAKDAGNMCGIATMASYATLT
jgi:C1A family cysteine protease